MFLLLALFGLQAPAKFWLLDASFGTARQSPVVLEDAPWSVGFLRTDEWPDQRAEGRAIRPPSQRGRLLRTPRPPTGRTPRDATNRPPPGTSRRRRLLPWATAREPAAAACP